MRSTTLLATSLFTLILLTLVFSGCTDETMSPPPPSVDTGTADFTRYVAIGNSLDAGFQSNALSRRDQVYAYTNLIADQVHTPFEMPLIKDPGIGNRVRLK